MKLIHQWFAGALLVAASLISGGCLAAPRLLVGSGPPVFPFWKTADVMKAEMLRQPLPEPVGSAVLVARGYLISSQTGLHDILTDVAADPSVAIFDPRTGVWYAGVIVDNLPLTSVAYALLRADVPGKPLRFSVKVKSQVWKVVGYPAVLLPGTTRQLRSYDASRCFSRRPPTMIHTRLVSGVRGTEPFCLRIAGPVLAGAVFLDRDGGLVGIKTGPNSETHTIGGYTAADTKALLDLYFATWGAGVKKKPAY